MEILIVVALVVGVVALGMGWMTMRQLRELNGRLDRMQSTLYETRIEMREQQEKNENRLATLDVAVQKATGKMRFSPNVPLTVLYETEPRAEGILAGFHIGGCASCAVDENSTLGEAVRERGADLDRVLAALNTLPANGERVDLRVPNVRFEG